MQLYYLVENCTINSIYIIHNRSIKMWVKNKTENKNVQTRKSIDRCKNEKKQNGILCDDSYLFYEQCSYVTIVCIILFSSRLIFLYTILVFRIHCICIVCVVCNCQMPQFSDLILIVIFIYISPSSLLLH